MTIMQGFNLIERTSCMLILAFGKREVGEVNSD